MPVDERARGGAPTAETEGSMFAPTPLWARDSERRRGRSPAARSMARPGADPAMDAGEAGAGAGVMGATTAAEPADAAYETQPVRTEAPRGVPAGAVIAAAVAVAALGAAGWWASRPHDRGMAELTPGVPAPHRTALATAAPPSAVQPPRTPATADAAAPPATP